MIVVLAILGVGAVRADEMRRIEDVAGSWFAIGKLDVDTLWVDASGEVSYKLRRGGTGRNFNSGNRVPRAANGRGRCAPGLVGRRK